jgi:hypothetical protein
MVRYSLVGAVAVIALSGCASVSTGGSEAARAPQQSREVDVVYDSKHDNRVVARTIKVPKGHYPPPGQCRLWFEGRPPGRQPRVTKCESLRGNVPAGAFILYNDQAWDTDYDWARHSRRNRGQVPSMIVRLTQRIDGR